MIAHTSTAAPEAGPAPARRLVTDAPTRMFHWLFALCFAGAYLTAESEHWRMLHVTLGYSFGGLLVFRVLYGLFGPRQAGLSVLLRKLSALRSPRTLTLRQAPHLAMAGAIVALLALATPLVLSGWVTWQEWGDLLGGDWPEELHEVTGNLVLAAVLLHLGLIAALSVLQRRNVARAMLTGRLPGSGPSPVRHNRAGLAAALLAAVLAFGAWQWHSAPQGLLPDAGAHGHHDDDHDGS